MFSLLCLLSPARATQVIERTPQQLGEQSSLVVRGRVVAIESYWNANHTKIFTRTRVAVDQSYKGSATGTVDVVQLGGVVDGMRVTVQGATMWRENEEVVLFLEPYVAGSYQVAGFSQGKFDVERDPETGRAFIRRPATEGVQLMTTGPNGQPVPSAAASAVTRTPLDQFINGALGANR